jgi:hypothetical protein
VRTKINTNYNRHFFSYVWALIYLYIQKIILQKQNETKRYFSRNETKRNDINIFQKLKRNETKKKKNVFSPLVITVFYLFIGKGIAHSIENNSIEISRLLGKEAYMFISQIFFLYSCIAIILESFFIHIHQINI